MTTNRISVENSSSNGIIKVATISALAGILTGILTAGIYLGSIDTSLETHINNKEQHATDAEIRMIVRDELQGVKEQLRRIESKL